MYTTFNISRCFGGAMRTNSCAFQLDFQQMKTFVTLT